MNAMVNRPKTERLIGLEVLRFLAAVGVLVWHYQHFLFVGPYQSPVEWNSRASPEKRQPSGRS